MNRSEQRKNLLKVIHMIEQLEDAAFNPPDINHLLDWKGMQNLKANFEFCESELSKPFSYKVPTGTSQNDPGGNITFKYKDSI